MVDPVAVEDVPEDAAQISRESATLQIPGMRSILRIEQRVHQRDQRDPRKRSPPGWQGTRNWEGKIEEKTGEERQHDRGREPRGGGARDGCPGGNHGHSKLSLAPAVVGFVVGYNPSVIAFLQFAMHFLTVLFFIGLAGSSIVVILSFIEDLGELLGED